MNSTARRTGACVVLALILASQTPVPRAQSVPAIDRNVTYILPQWFGFLSATQAEVDSEVAQLRSKLGPEGIRAKVGFTTYIAIDMTPVDPADTVAIRAALAPALAQMDSAIGKAVQAGIPICFSFATAIRDRTDPAQSAAQAADVRSVQWYADNTIAPVWITLSRYARKHEALEEAFIREMGRQLAARMLQYPNTVVASSGDAEVELSYDKSIIVDSNNYDETTSLLADYSPFAIAEFRDWVRRGGLYAPGEAFSGEWYALSARYAGDATPAVDTNSDGHTFNVDFGTSFATWELKHFEWALSDSTTADPRVIPQSVYDAPGFDRKPGDTSNPAGFDAPRVRNPNDAFWRLWDLFRQTMVYRHNLTFAKWMTTSSDPASGAVVPADRWFSDQIVADYLFTNVIIDPHDLTGFAQPATFRLDTSASPHWTADVRPYGSFGITSFNLNVGMVPANQGNVYYRTLAAVAPAIAALKVRWGILEWHPSAPDSAETTVYDKELALLEQYRPALLVPFYWDTIGSARPGLGPQFERLIRTFVSRRNNVPLTLSRSTVYATTLTTGAARSAPQVVRVTGEPGEAPSFTASSASDFVDIVMAADGRSFTVALKEQAYAPGAQSATVTVTPTAGQGYTPSTLTIQVTANLPGTTAAPFGSFDTPADLQVVTGEVGITGWAVDDVGIASIKIYRSSLAGEPTENNSGLVFLGTASPVEGARPDVESVHGTIPGSSQAGWGYMLLSNFMPNAGNGVYTIHAIVTDLEGRTASLGTRRIDCRNGQANTPFGTIDTPLQGQTVSGTIVNFGWALTPNPLNVIPLDGSTIDVIIDGVVVGHPTYNNFRADIAGLFPGLQNTNGAVGYFHLDTRTLTNGVHTIAWVVRDNTGAATGMGSRFFTVANP